LWAGKQERRSFLKKRTKKLLSIWSCAGWGLGLAGEGEWTFFACFLQTQFFTGGLPTLLHGKIRAVGTARLTPSYITGADRFSCLEGLPFFSPAWHGCPP
jgi:hypothetical protein